MIIWVLCSGERKSSQTKHSESPRKIAKPVPKKKLPVFESEGGLTEEENPNPKPQAYKSKKAPPAIKYRAKQVILREDTGASSIPLGTHFIARLLTSIDTREKGHWVKAILPQGARFKDKASIPKGTLLIGQVAYSGRGKKVFLSFSQGVLPNGQEFKVQAHAVSLKDKALGIKGKYHSGNMGKIATTLGLGMVEGMADALTEKEALGEFGAITPKANMENALYHGLAQVTDMEIQRRTREQEAIRPYVIVPAGTAFIVELTASIQGGFLNNE